MRDGVEVMAEGNGITEVFDLTLKNAQNTQTHDSTDYINPDDGLVYCGKCHTPKQARMEVFGEPRTVPITCQCRQRELEALEKRESERQDMDIVAKLRHRSLMDEKFASQTFASFLQTSQNGNVFRLCQRYVDGFDEMLRRNQGLLFDIVDSRYRADLPMILTTNLNLEDMKTEQDIRRSRIYDRIFEVCYPVKFTGISFRKAEANKRFREMRSFMEGDGQ